MSESIRAAASLASGTGQLAGASPPASRRPAPVGPADPEGSGETADCPREQRRSELLQAWIDTVARTSFMPGGRVKARAVLEESLQRLAAALVAEPFEPIPGYRVGFELVSAQIAAPRALG